MISQPRAVAYKRATRRNRNIQTYSATTAMGPLSATLFLVVILGVLALLYLTQITKTSIYGYQVNSLSTEKQELLERQQELAVEAARLQAVARIQSSEVAKGLEPESQVSFSNN